MPFLTCELFAADFRLVTLAFLLLLLACLRMFLRSMQLHSEEMREAAILGVELHPQATEIFQE